MFYRVLNITLSSIFKDHFEEFLDSSVNFLFFNLTIGDFPVGIYLLKVNNRKTRTSCETCSCVSVVNFEQVIAG